jgi:hypothetical protein
MVAAGYSPYYAAHHPSEVYSNSVGSGTVLSPLPMSTIFMVVDVYDDVGAMSTINSAAQFIADIPTDSHTYVEIYTTAGNWMYKGMASAVTEESKREMVKFIYSATRQYFMAYLHDVIQRVSTVVLRSVYCNPTVVVFSTNCVHVFDKYVSPYNTAYDARLQYMFFVPSMPFNAVYRGMAFDNSDAWNTYINILGQHVPRVSSMVAIDRNLVSIVPSTNHRRQNTNTAYYYTLNDSNVSMFLNDIYIHGIYIYTMVYIYPRYIYIYTMVYVLILSCLSRYKYTINIYF